MAQENPGTVRCPASCPHPAGSHVEFLFRIRREYHLDPRPEVLIPDTFLKFE